MQNKKTALGLDRVLEFAIFKVVKLTALSVRRDGGFIFYE